MRLILLLCGLSLCCRAGGPGSVLLVFAHPDDETVIGPLLAKLSHEGARIHLLTITSGQKGATPNTEIPIGDRLGAVREDELRCSAKALGIPEPQFLRMQDQGISTSREMEEIARAVRAAIDRHKPDVVITWGPDGLTGHPDHRVASDVATQVFQQRAALASPPRKLYYVAFPESRFRQSPLPFRTVSDRWITTEIDCRAFLKQHFTSQRCHRTQWGERQIAQKEQMFSKMLDGRVFLRLALTDGPFPRERESSVLQGLD